MKLTLRKTQLNDYETLLKIYSQAREFMKKNGNPDQWKDYWPDNEIVLEDINTGKSYVVTDETNHIYCVFAYIVGVDKTYLKIDEGNWISNDPYATIHRLASTMEIKDIFSFVISELDKDPINIRADTHKNNIPMQKQLLKNGFVYCGIIQCIEGGDRLAYERLKRTN